MEREFCFKDLSPEDLRKLQLRLTAILDEFDSFCKKHNLTYFLTAGSCLGAIRHQGFIPWDDDLDVCLPRKDYDKLTKLWNKCHPKGEYVLCRPGKDILTGVHITQIKDSSTTCVYRFSKQYDICQGIKIDVEPLDGAPDSKLGQLKQTFYANLYGLFAAQRVPTHYQPTWKKIVARMVLPVFNHKKFCYKVFSMAEKKVKKYNIDKCRYVKWNFGAIHQVYEKDVFLPVSYAMFEGKMRPVPHKTDEYLRLIFNDYMQMPPVEKRIPITKVLAYDLDHSYDEYRKLHSKSRGRSGENK